MARSHNRRSKARGPRPGSGDTRAPRAPRTAYPAPSSDGAFPGPAEQSTDRSRASRDPAWIVPSPLPTPLTPPAGFIEQARGVGIEFEGDDLARLGLYLALLLDANSAFNLTAIRDPAEAWTRHILDSLTLIPVLAESPDGARVIDVGSGGGLPGVPLAIAMPTMRFTLLEATSKKSAFLRDIREPLGIANVDVLNQRAESAAHTRKEDGHREKYAAAVARAVGPIAVIAELTAGFVEVGGVVALIKGEKAQHELEEGAKACEMLGLSHAGTIQTPTGRVVVLDKIKPMSRMYPRADGEPKRVPLGVKRP